jgi:cell wall-associated NlpC family hydrolase
MMETPVRRTLTMLATVTALTLASTVGAHAWTGTVQPGDSGPQVHRLQSTLEEWRPGILNGSIGGRTTARFGPRTLAAVQEAAGPLRGHHNPSNSYRVGSLFMAELDAAVGNSNGGSSTRAASSSSSRGQRVVDAARNMVGAPYAFGGNGPAYDCSGVVQNAWADAGVSLPRTSSQQFASGTRVSSPRAGDIVGLDFAGNGRVDHVGIYVGNGRMVDASGGQQRVVERAVIQRAVVGYARP